MLSSKVVFYSIVMTISLCIQFLVNAEPKLSLEDKNGIVKNFIFVPEDRPSLKSATEFPSFNDADRYILKILLDELPHINHIQNKFKRGLVAKYYQAQIQNITMYYNHPVTSIHIKILELLNKVSFLIGNGHVDEFILNIKNNLRLKKIKIIILKNYPELTISTAD